jgi:hypothetical protein
MMAVAGLIGAYPNAFFRLKQSELPEFVQAVSSLKSEDDYRRLSDRFGVRRTDPNFWRFSDLLQAAEAGMSQADRGPARLQPVGEPLRPIVLLSIYL